MHQYKQWVGTTTTMHGNKNNASEQQQCTDTNNASKTTTMHQTNKNASEQQKCIKTTKSIEITKTT